jgi:hypothetical protein
MSDNPPYEVDPLDPWSVRQRADTRFIGRMATPELAKLTVVALNAAAEKPRSVDEEVRDAIRSLDELHDRIRDLREKLPVEHVVQTVQGSHIAGANVQIAKVHGSVHY